ncbi:serine hydrolase domain-containing protein [Brevibacterium luteolum]|uniref:Class A beta-lactamase-related serine hydrolase n=1 Tax=Brevibacterium luteolum TaxID=199591 RepID=A0A6G8KXQ6_9MICO|nr:serine hydrolase domain-containing protein [Brevibacterium luteolum]QIN29597.1 class A beta-lactamase-related serine hydrolase [Brevibacterium luteolum]
MKATDTGSSPEGTGARIGTSRSFSIGAGVLAAILAIGLFIIAPVPRTLPSHVTGDAAVMDAVLPALEKGPRTRLALAQISPDGETVFAGKGADEHAIFEIGSITKTFTGALLAIAIEEGEVTPETTVAEIIPEVDSEAGSITLTELATHRSGLPRLGYTSTAHRAEFFVRSILGRDPYDETDEDLIAILNQQDLPDDPEPEYSNLGFAVLGMVLARAAGTDYPTLLEDRILDPLELNDTSLIWDEQDLPPEPPLGYTVHGDRVEAWAMGASSPAGGIRSSSHDLAIWASAVADGTAPGAAGFEPLDDYTKGRQIGMAWITVPPEAEDEQLVTYHNGGTSGYSSFLGIGEDGYTLVVLADSQTDVDGALDVVKGSGHSE